MGLRRGIRGEGGTRVRRRQPKVAEPGSEPVLPEGYASRSVRYLAMSYKMVRAPAARTRVRVGHQDRDGVRAVGTLAGRRRGPPDGARPADRCPPPAPGPRAWARSIQTLGQRPRVDDGPHPDTDAAHTGGLWMSFPQVVEASRRVPSVSAA